MIDNAYSAKIRNLLHMDSKPSFLLKLGRDQEIITENKLRYFRLTSI